MKQKILSVISFLLLCTTVVCAIAIIRIYVQRAQDIKGFEELSQLIYETTEDTQFNDTTTIEDNSDSTQVQSKPKPVKKRNLAPLFELNSDCAGWVSVPNTTIDYPFMHTPEDGQKYLRKNFDGEYSLSGIPFLQENCTLDGDNIIIYGHNMKNGTMFSDLTGYLDRDFCDKNSTIELETADGLKLFSVYTAAQVKGNHPWYGFTHADSKESFDEKLSLLDGSLLYTTDAVPEYGRPILTLSTCYGPTQADRLIVIAVLQD